MKPDRLPFLRRLRPLVVGVAALAVLLPGLALAAADFGDVGAGHPHGPGIDFVADVGVTAGCGDGSNYCPNDPVTRAQMGTFMHRLAGRAAGIAPSVNAWRLDGRSRNQIVGDAVTAADGLLRPRVTRGSTGLGQNLTLPATNTSQKVVDLGTFTKQRAETRLEVSFVTHALTSAAHPATCRWQLRIDGRNAAGSTAIDGSARLDGYEAHLTRSPNHVALTFATEFLGVGTGTRTLELWVDGQSGSECFHNPGFFTRRWQVTELLP